MTSDPTHIGADRRWLRALKSELLPEGDTLRALLHIAGCAACLSTYEAATAYKAGEFEAESRALREQWLLDQGANQPAEPATAASPRWAARLVDLLNQEYEDFLRAAMARRDALSGALGGQQPAWQYLGAGARGGEALPPEPAAEWRKALLAEDDLILEDGTQCHWWLHALRDEQGHHSLSVEFSPEARTAVEGLRCTLTSDDFASRPPAERNGNRHHVEVTVAVADGEAEFTDAAYPGAHFPFVVGGKFLPHDPPAIRLELSSGP
jgi:hypothetical protein